MAIDDNPLDIIKNQIEADERERSPVTDLVISTAAEMVPGGGRLKDFIDRQRIANRELLIDELTRQVKTLMVRFEELDKNHQQFLRTEFMSLVMDGLQKSESLRAKERIKRLAAILANAARAGPLQSPDATEELMRVAMEVSDVEVEFLHQLDQSGRFADSTRGLATIDEANEEWKKYRPRIAGYDRSDGQSMAAKLQSLGLIESVERRPNISSVEDTPCRMLRKGNAFIRFVKNLS